MVYEWNLNHLYNNKKEWEDDTGLLESNLKCASKIKQKVVENIDDFLEYVKLKIEIDRLMEKVYCYPKRHLDLNSKDEEKQNMLNVALSLYAKVEVVTSAFDSIILKNEQKIRDFIKDKKLSHYKRYLELIIRRKKHIIDPKTMKIVSKYNKIINASKTIYRSLVESDMKFGTIKDENNNDITVNRNNYNHLITSKNPEVRKNAFNTFINSYSSIINTLTSLLDTKLENEIIYSQMESYNSLLDKKMYIDELPYETIENIIETINKNLHIMHNFIALKKQILELSEFHLYDNSLTLSTLDEPKISIDEAIEQIKQALSILGNEYISNIDIAFNEGWVDVYSKKNKRKTSFSCISYCGVPYSSINYGSNINSLRTLAHELGHAIHTQYAKNQPFEYFEYSLSLAEIASKVNEILLNEYLFNNAKNKEEKIYILENTISSISNSLFGQCLLTEFEHTIINKKLNNETLTSEYLNNLYMEIIKIYNGTEVIYDDSVKYGWAKVPHYFIYDSYYIYQYITGVAIASSIAYDILNNKKDSKKQYLNFLKAGNSKNIKETLSILDIDLTKADYINKTLALLSSKIELLKKLI